MHQKDLVRQTWESAGLYSSEDSKLQEFLKFFDNTPTACWPEVVEMVRNQYSEYLEKLVLPLWKSGDKLLRLNLIRAANLDHEKEKQILTELVGQCDLQQDKPELRAAIEKDSQPAIDLVLTCKELPQGLKSLAELRHQQIQAKLHNKPMKSESS